MKDLVKEVPNEGLESLIGQRVTLFCGVYIYTGTLVMWLGLYLWAKNEGIGGDNPFDRALGDLFKR